MAERAAVPYVTQRLRLVAVTPALKLAMQSSRAAFADCAGLTLPDGWPEFPEAFAGDTTTPEPWHGYLFVLRDAAQLIGNGGFVAPPDAAGAVEIGYEIGPAFRNKGYATEAAAGLVELAFAHGARMVVAHSLASPNASTAVMQKLGMARVAEIASDGGTIWRWQVARAGS